MLDTSAGKSVFFLLEGHRDSGCTNNAYAWQQRIAFSPDGRALASIGGDDTIRLWDSRTGKNIAVLRQSHEGEPSSVAFSPDGKTLAFGGAGTIELRDASSGKRLALCSGHTDRVCSLEFSPDGKTLASASLDGSAKLWDALAGKCRATLPGIPGWPSNVAFSPDGNTLASAGEKRTIKLWDTTTGANTATLKPIGYNYNLDGPAGMRYLAFSPDGKRLAAATSLEMQQFPVKSVEKSAMMVCSGR